MTKDRWLMVVTCAVCSLVGGFAANLWFRPHPAEAQTQANAGVLTARRFEVVDDAGNVRGMFGFDGGGLLHLEMRETTHGSKALVNIGPMVTTYKDFKGQRRLGLGIFADSGPGLNVYDATGKATFSVK